MYGIYHENKEIHQGTNNLGIDFYQCKSLINLFYSQLSGLIETHPAPLLPTQENLVPTDQQGYENSGQIDFVNSSTETHPSRSNDLSKSNNNIDERGTLHG